MMEWTLKTTSGMHHFLNNLIRLISNVDKFDEFALVLEWRQQLKITYIYINLSVHILNSRHVAERLNSFLGAG